MRRAWTYGLVMLFPFAVGCAEAGWPGAGMFSGISSGYHVNKMWPDPHLLPDRNTISNTMSVFVARGWQRQCLLGEHHFTEDRKLSQAGELRVKYILTQPPPEMRTIYVERGKTEELTRARIDAVQQYAANTIPNGPLPDVQASNLISEGWSADYVDTVNKKYQSSTPTPRLQSASDGGSGGAGGP